MQTQTQLHRNLIDNPAGANGRRRVKIEFNHDLEVSDLLGGASIADVLTKLGSL
jgi:hypothetical protein